MGASWSMWLEIFKDPEGAVPALTLRQDLARLKSPRLNRSRLQPRNLDLACRNGGFPVENKASRITILPSVPLLAPSFAFNV